MNKFLKRFSTVALLASAVAVPFVAIADGEDAGNAKPLVPPQTWDFKSSDDVNGWTIIDANNDTKEWTYDAYEQSMKMSYNGSEAMDDWLITPALQLEAGKLYTISFDTKSASSTYVEKIEVKYGTENTAGAMTEVAVEPTVVDWTDFQSISVEIVPAEAGIHYIGFHGISDPDKYYLYVTNISISAPFSAGTPVEVTGLTATADPNGANKATISFTTPTEDRAGNALTELTKVEISRDNEVVKTIEEPGLGEAITYVDETDKGGTFNYTVVAYNEEGAGAAATITVFVGFDKPKGVESVSFEETANPGEVLITWTPVTEDVNGLNMTEDDVTYNIYRLSNFHKYSPSSVLVAENVKGSSLTVSLVDEGEQDYLTVEVEPVTSAGEGPSATADAAFVGTPYSTLHESFANSDLTYAFNIEQEGGAYYYLYPSYAPSTQDNDGGCIEGTLAYNDAALNLVSGYIDVTGVVNPTLSFYTLSDVYGYYEYPNENLIGVYLKKADSDEWETLMEPKAVNEICEELKTWTKVSCLIPAEYAGSKFQFKIVASANGNNTRVYLDNIVLEEKLDHDLAVTSISAPARVKVGASFNVDVTIFNRGANVAEGYAVELYKDGNLVDSKEGEAVAPEASAQINFDCTMPVLQENLVEYYAKIVYEADLNEENDKSTIATVEPKVSTLPVATDLEATQTDDNILLEWVRPDLENLKSEPFTENFETGEPGAAEFEGWTFIDVDGETQEFQADVFGMKSGVTTGAFFVMNDQGDFYVSYPNRYGAHSGNQYLWAVGPYGWYADPSDDWAVSPELSGEAQTVTFYAKSTTDYSGYYLQDMDICYSTGSMDPEDFIPVDGFKYISEGSDEEVEVEGKHVKVPNVWTKFIVELPAGAQHLAIHSYGDNYELLIDDVTYAPVNPATFEILGYNIYRNGEKINDEPVNETTYTDNLGADGQYFYRVTVVYKDRGESAGSNEVEISSTLGVDNVADGLVITVSAGNITVAGAEGQALVVSGVNGAVFFSGKASAVNSFDVAPGIYIVKAGNVARKVIVK